ncbi:MAG: TRAP transporter small permease [Desulfobacterales bacterium]|nr:TRAP transporter small permease [Desulfobacterales bacterium]
MKIILRGLDRFLNWLLVLLMGTMVAIISAQVWFRFILNDPLHWSEEIGRYLLVWITFIGAAVALRHRQHLGIDLLQNRVSSRIYHIVTMGANTLIQIFLVVIIYQGFTILGVVKFQKTPAMHISMALPYLAVPVGGCLMLINSLRLTWETLRSIKDTKIFP